MFNIMLTSECKTGLALLLLTLLSALAQAAEKFTCDLTSVTANAKKDFDLKKFAGNWSSAEMVSKDSADVVNAFTCDSFIYTPTSTPAINVTMWYRNASVSPPKREVAVQTRLIGNPEQPAVWTMKTGDFTVYHVILDTDYDTFATMYSCVDSTPPGEGYFSQIRAQTPSDEVKRTAASALSSALPKDFDKPPKSLVRSTVIQTDCDKN